jgi:hypothetical protein
VSAYCRRAGERVAGGVTVGGKERGERGKQANSREGGGDRVTASTIDESQRTAARVAGLTCLFAMVIVGLAHYGIYSRLVVAGNAAETAHNILAHERLFRIAAACDVLYSAGLLVLLAALYVILKPVNPGLALVGALCRLVYASMWVASTLNLFGALRLLGEANYLRAFEAGQLQALARLYLGANFDTYYVGLPFFGLASTVCSYLWWKSRYIPRALAAFGVVSSAGCVVCAFVFLIVPTFEKTVNAYWFDSPMGLFEMALSFWLLFKGLRPSGRAGTAPAAAATFPAASGIPPGI